MLCSVAAQDKKGAESSLELQVTLTDSSFFKGRPTQSDLPFKSSVGQIQLKLERVVYIAFSPEQPSVVQFRNADEMRGEPMFKALEIEALFGRVRIPRELIQSISVRSTPTAWEGFCQSMVVFYDFNAAGPQAQNQADAKHHARVREAAWVARGRVGGAYRFDASGQFITTPHHKDLSPPQVTLAGWLHPTAGGGWQGAMMKCTSGSWADGYGLSMYSGDAENIYFFINFYSTTRVKAPIPLHQWTHVVGTYDGRELRIYINGRLADQLAYAEGLKTNTLDLMIGQGTGGYAWKGQLDEMMLFNRALTANEVRALFESY